MQLKLSNNTITGNLGGKYLHCAVRMSQGTGSPAPGEYVIPPPESDAIYGQTALVLPLKQGSAGYAGMSVWAKVARADKIDQPSGWAQTELKMGFAPAMKWAAPLAGSAPASKMAAPRPGLASSAGGGAAESAGGAGAERQALSREVLVLSDKPIAGRNCLVVSLGFADLMLGLQATGGATLTVL
jgi:hypothetical protein